MQAILVRFGLILIFSVPLFAKNSFKYCSERDASQLSEASLVSEEALIHLIQDIENRVSTDSRSLGKKLTKKLVKAKYILKCSAKKIPKLKFECFRNRDTNVVMRTAPIFGTGVDVNTYYTEDLNILETAAVIIHEATHKCGTNDAAYFHGHPPKSTWRSSWHNIASTYDYWIQHGFCVPGIDCR